MVFLSCKQRSVVVSASLVVRLLIPYIEIKTMYISTNLDEMFFVKIEHKFTGFKQFVQSSENIIQAIWKRPISTCEIIIIVPPRKNITLDWQSIIC